jgi:hypothetical protein
MPGRTRRALKKRLNPSIGPTQALMRRWCCSTTLVKYQASADLNGILPTVIEFVVHALATQSGMGRFEAVQGSHMRVAVATERMKALGGGDVAGAAKVGLNRFAAAIVGTSSRVR